MVLAFVKGAIAGRHKKTFPSSAGFPLLSICHNRAVCSSFITVKEKLASPTPLHLTFTRSTFSYLSCGLRVWPIHVTARFWTFLINKLAITSFNCPKEIQLKFMTNGTREASEWVNPLRC